MIKEQFTRIVNLLMIRGVLVLRHGHINNTVECIFRSSLLRDIDQTILVYSNCIPTLRVNYLTPWAWVLTIYTICVIEQNCKVCDLECRCYGLKEEGGGFND